MAEFCIHEKHGGICNLTGNYCNLGPCPNEDIEEFAPLRHGRWIFEDDTKMIWTTKAICSVCNCVVAHNVDLSMAWGREKHKEENKYCPNCGAKMDGDID